jgi:hypothetical protein
MGMLMLMCDMTTKDTKKKVQAIIDEVNEEAVEKNLLPEDPEEDPGITQSQLFDADRGIEVERMPMCEGCPCEYLNIFLEKAEKLDNYTADREYKVKCSHFAACRRARYMGKREARMEGQRGLDRAQV